MSDIEYEDLPPDLKQLYNERMLESKARLAYDAYVSNHPNIHTNKFQSWDELDFETRDDWRNKVKVKILNG